MPCAHCGPEMRFLIKHANHDAGRIELELEDAQSVLDVKRAILSAWPQQGLGSAPAHPDALRVMCMGRMLLESDDKKAIRDAGLPSLGYPTPLHVAVRTAFSAPPPHAAPGASPLPLPREVRPPLRATCDGVAPSD
jgi:hypothetical protein